MDEKDTKRVKYVCMCEKGMCGSMIELNNPCKCNVSDTMGDDATGWLEAAKLRELLIVTGVI